MEKTAGEKLMQSCSPALQGADIPPSKSYCDKGPVSNSCTLTFFFLVIVNFKTQLLRKGFLQQVTQFGGTHHSCRFCPAGIGPL